MLISEIFKEAICPYCKDFIQENFDLESTMCYCHLMMRIYYINISFRMNTISFTIKQNYKNKNYFLEYKDVSIEIDDQEFDDLVLKCKSLLNNLAFQ